MEGRKFLHYPEATEEDKANGTRFSEEFFDNLFIHWYKFHMAGWYKYKWTVYFIIWKVKKRVKNDGRTIYVLVTGFRGTRRWTTNGRTMGDD